MNKQTVMTKNFDISGNGIIRLVRFYLLGRILPMGNNHGGPGWRCLLVLMLFHFWGRQCYWFNNKCSRQIDFLRVLKRRLQKT